MDREEVLELIGARLSIEIERKRVRYENGYMVEVRLILDGQQISTNYYYE